MPNRLAVAAERLTQRLGDHASESIIYSTAAGSVLLELSASIGSTPAEQEAEGGVVYRTELRDYLISSADLATDGLRFEPKAGDLIIQTINEEERVFEVVSVGGEPPFRYCDPGKARLRVHTKSVDGDE